MTTTRPKAKAKTKTRATNAARSNATLLRHLRELIAALDRRVPHIERVGESQIAADARALRRDAQLRVAELEKS
jgi:hypothetical protein